MHHAEGQVASPSTQSGILAGRLLQDCISVNLKFGHACRLCFRGLAV